MNVPQGCVRVASLLERKALSQDQTEQHHVPTQVQTPDTSWPIRMLHALETSDWPRSGHVTPI